MSVEQLNALTKETLDAALRVHTSLGPGLLESAYTACLVYELRKLEIEIAVEVPVPLVYEGVKLADVACRIDILVADQLVIQVKSIEKVLPAHLLQLTSYLKLANRRIGLLLNFNVERFRDGIFRQIIKL